MLETKILAAILGVAQPGHTEYSRTPVGVCDDECAVSVAALSGKRVKYDFTGRRGKWPGATRAETRMEGMGRFATIATAIAQVVNRPPAKWSNRLGVRLPREQLWRALVTIASHESAFWKSIQSGTIRGAAGEWGLFQLHPSVLKSLGVTGPEIVGTDLDSTIRSAAAAAELLARTRQLCPPRGDDWFGPAISAYGSGKGCNVADDWVTDRVDTYGLTARWIKMPFDAYLALHSVGVKNVALLKRPLRVRQPLPRAGFKVSEVTSGTPECPNKSSSPCLARVAYVDIPKTALAAASKLLGLYHSYPLGTEVWFRDKASDTDLVGVVSRHGRRTAIELMSPDFCGSVGAATCH